MTNITLSPNLKLTTAGELEAGDLAFLSTRHGIDGLILMTDKKGPRTLPWILYFGPSHAVFLPTLMGTEPVARIDSPVRVRLPISEESPQTRNPIQLSEGELRIGTAAGGTTFAAALSDQGVPAYVCADGTAMTDTHPEYGYWWSRAMLEYRGGEGDTWRLLAELNYQNE